MSLQKAIEAPEVARLRFVSEAPDSHQLDMVAHQLAQCAAERRGLSKRFERLIGLGASRARRIALLLFTWYSARRSATGLLVIELPEPRNPGSDLRYGLGAAPWMQANAWNVHTARLRAYPDLPVEIEIDAELRFPGMFGVSDDNIDGAYLAAQAELSEITSDGVAVGVGPAFHKRTSCPGISRAMARKSSVTNFR
jgi:hypothetical protein